ncbi:hypothetical protein CCZ01_01625 [Helicobacter monodelphidis]|uniref:Cj0069 family protein n=1 Tax=Helicobacter sp. 15-1451 TaxID=2004995 RepID=UPI000DCD2B43|nr:Cj0069 family protein [Helicobacter sp. 15-1451]RAX58920.1 hypothetical protein CCZ01_01625 [Helicobacter sp. 15-1451]
MQKMIIFEACKQVEGRDRIEREALLEALRSKGWEGEVKVFEVSQKEELFESISKSASGYFSRIELENLYPLERESYLELLRSLERVGVFGVIAPNVIEEFSRRDSLLKLISNGLVAEDSYGYGNKERFKDSFPYSLVTSERVLKPSFGSEGIWRVRTLENKGLEDKVKLSDMIEIFSAKEHQLRTLALGDFLEGYSTYIDETKAILDLPFLADIARGELSVLINYDTPCEILCKIPAKGMFGTSLFMGAQYRYEFLDSHRTLIKTLKAKIPEICLKLANGEIPPIWSADFIPHGEHYILNRLKVGCVSFATRIDLVQEIAHNMIKIIKNKRANGI